MASLTYHSGFQTISAKTHVIGLKSRASTEMAEIKIFILFLSDGGKLGREDLGWPTIEGDMNHLNLDVTARAKGGPTKEKGGTCLSIFS